MDSSGNRNTGTITGATWTSGKLGKGLSFDKSSDYVEIGNNIKIDNSHIGTITAWAKATTDKNGGGRVFNYGGSSQFGTGNYLGLTLTGTAAFFIYNDDPFLSNSISIASLTKGVWHHIAVVSEGSEYFMYVDGVARSFSVSGNNDGAWFADVTAVSPVMTTIGVERSDGNFYNLFKGLIDDVRIYKRALTAAEILLYQSGAATIKQ